jgi:hypothetical protein
LQHASDPLLLAVERAACLAGSTEHEKCDGQSGQALLDEKSSRVPAKSYQRDVDFP